MSWDLALGPTNDLVLAPNRDFKGVSGINLVEQRIRTRLKMQRGSWVYDTDGTLGSQITSVIGEPVEKASSQLTAYVYEALDDMEDISVVQVSLEPTEDERSIVLLVGFLMTVDPNQAPFQPTDEEIHEVTIQFQL